MLWRCLSLFAKQHSYLDGAFSVDLKEGRRTPLALYWRDLESDHISRHPKPVCCPVKSSARRDGVYNHVCRGISRPEYGPVGIGRFGYGIDQLAHRLRNL